MLSSPLQGRPDGVVRPNDQPLAKHVSALGLAYIDLGQSYLASTGYKSGMARRLQRPLQAPPSRAGLLGRSVSTSLLPEHRPAPAAPRMAASASASVLTGAAAATPLVAASAAMAQSQSHGQLVPASWANTGARGDLGGARPPRPASASTADAGSRVSTPSAVVSGGRAPKRLMTTDCVIASDDER